MMGSGKVLSVNVSMEEGFRDSFVLVVMSAQCESKGDYDRVNIVT